MTRYFVPVLNASGVFLSDPMKLSISSPLQNREAASGSRAMRSWWESFVAIYPAYVYKNVSKGAWLNENKLYLTEWTLWYTGLPLNLSFPRMFSIFFIHCCFDFKILLVYLLFGIFYFYLVYMTTVEWTFNVKYIFC